MRGNFAYYAVSLILNPASVSDPATVDGRLGSAASVTLRSPNFAVPAGQTYTQNTKHGAFSGCISPPPVDFPYIASTRTVTVAQTTQTITSSPAGATLTVDGTACTAPCSATWFSGTTHTVTAPSQILVGGVLSQFTGWSNGITALSQIYTTPSTSSTLTANYSTPPPTMIITTAPAGPAVIVDGVSCSTPCVKVWTPGSSHTVAVVSPQTYGGNTYSFVSWSDGGANFHSITASATTLTATLTAQPSQYTLTTSVSPAGAGSISPPGGTYSAGTQVQLVATAAAGYTFQSWSGVDSSNGATAMVTMNGARNVVANFTGGGTTVPVTVTTNHTGIQFVVDGTTYSSSVTFQWTPGSSHSVAVSNPTQDTNGTRFAFGSWSDGGAQNHIT